jgi:AmmeMemoRadiSam system protein A
MSSAETHGELLLEIARRSIAHGVGGGGPLPVALDAYPGELGELRATFVTLRTGGALRGCTGALEATQPLVIDVACNAHRAAFGDPRFPAVDEAELTQLDLKISLLSPLEPFPVTSEADLLAQLRQGVDGLVLRDGAASGTFLPAVWKTLPSPRDFVDALKSKAGLPADRWSATLTCQRYTTVEIG